MSGPTSLVFSLALVLLSAGPALADHEWLQDRPLDQQLDELLRLAMEEARGIDSLLDAADRPSVQRELHNKAGDLTELLSRARDVGRQIEGGAGVVLEAPGLSVRVQDPNVYVEPPRVRDPDVYIEPPPPMEPAYGPAACDSADFARVLASVKGETFANQQLRVLESAVRDRWFDVRQVKRVMAAFTFSEQKIDAAALMYPRVVDQQNWYTVYEALTFDSDKEELRKRVGR